MMSRDDMLAGRAPCGLNCAKCLAFEGGGIQSHALALGELLGPGFAPYAQRFSGLEPAFKHYAEFRSLLDYFSAAPCRGCREGGCLFKECRVPGCASSHRVDFCFQCGEFPCSEHGLPERLEAVWRRNNELMRDKGLEVYWRTSANKPRYP